MRALHLALALAAARAALQRAPCEHFIILKYAHTGSTWFVDELNGIERFHVIEEFLMERFKESGEVPTSSQDIKDHFVEALTRECEAVWTSTDLRGPPRHRVDGVRRPKCNLHTGARATRASSA